MLALAASQLGLLGGCCGGGVGAAKTRQEDLDLESRFQNKDDGGGSAKTNDEQEQSRNLDKAGFDSIGGSATNGIPGERCGQPYFTQLYPLTIPY